MSRPLSTHPFFASRFIRAMALLAWLLLTLSSPGVSMAGMTGAATDGMPAEMAPMTMQNSIHSAMADHHVDHCCGNNSNAQCHCDAMCGSALAPALLALSGSVLPADIYVPLRGIDAPTPDFVPPLRPPAD